MIRPILPKYLWDRIDRNLTTQGKGRAWENYETNWLSMPRLLLRFEWKLSFEGREFWEDVFTCLNHRLGEGLEAVFQKHKIEI